MRSPLRTLTRTLSWLAPAALMAAGLSAPATAGSLPTEVNIRLASTDKSAMSKKSYWWTNEAASDSYVKFVEAG
ncbi:MAG: hypothetical protein RL745_254, partial [Actinomycetota bacterium]